MKAKLLGILSILVPFLIFSEVSAQIFKQVDEKGTVLFSDNPVSTIFDKQQKGLLSENALELVSKRTIGNRRLADEELKYDYRGIRVSATGGQRATASATSSRTQSRTVGRA